MNERIKPYDKERFEGDLFRLFEKFLDEHKLGVVNPEELKDDQSMEMVRKYVEQEMKPADVKQYAEFLRGVGPNRSQKELLDFFMIEVQKGPDINLNVDEESSHLVEFKEEVGKLGSKFGFDANNLKPADMFLYRKFQKRETSLLSELEGLSSRGTLNKDQKKFVDYMIEILGGELRDRI
jgi:hypothetical protein